MISKHVGLSSLFMTAPTLGGHLIHEGITPGRTDLMRCMAIHAGRIFLFFSVLGYRVVTLDVVIINTLMAGGAGGRNILGINRRELIGLLQDIMRRVAVGTNCTNC